MVIESELGLDCPYGLARGEGGSDRGNEPVDPGRLSACACPGPTEQRTQQSS